VTRQLKRHSAAEAVMNTASGFAISYAAGFFIFPTLGWQVTPEQNLAAVSFYTAISVVRSYLWRRAFNWWHHRQKGPLPCP